VSSVTVGVRVIVVLTGSLLMAGSSAATTVFYGPLPYLSAADSPFAVATIEDFTDGLLNVPGTSISGGTAALSCLDCDSVDGDDGLIDGNGNDGGSWYSNGETSLTITFDPVALGGLPTQAGVVWTDVGFGGGFFANVTFEVFGPGGISLGTIGPIVLGDGLGQGQTGEDRFFGIFNSTGISHIRIVTDNGDWEIDHIQYGFGEPVPEPSVFGLFGLATAAVGILRRRRL